MSYVLDTLDNVIKEELPNLIRDGFQKISPFFENVISTSMGVQRDGLGRNFQFLIPFEEGMAGASQFETTPLGPAVRSGLYNSNLMGDMGGFPSYDESTFPAYNDITVTLKELRGNMFFPYQYLRADRMTASIVNTTKRTLVGTARRLDLQSAICFFTNDATNVTIGDVGTVSSTLTNNGTANVTVDIEGTNASGQIGRVRDGLAVDLYDSTGTTKRNSNFDVFVDLHDPLNGTFHLVAADGASLLTLSNDDIIVMKNSKGLGFSGLNSWIKSSGTLFGVALAQHPQLKSLIISSIGSALTDLILDKYFAQFHKSYPGVTLDTLVMTPGVKVGWLHQRDGLFRMAVQGERPKVAAGYNSNVTYEYDGMMVTCYTEPLLGSGEVYALKTGDGNIKRYVPPQIEGTGSDGTFDASVEFVAGLGNGSGIFKHAHKASGGTADVLEAPFMLIQEWCPDEPRAIKLGGATETMGTP